MVSWYAWGLGGHHGGFKLEIKRVMDSTSPSRLLETNVHAFALAGPLADDVPAF